MSRGPGKWQAAILAELEGRPLFALAAHFDARAGRPLSRAELSALHRAAHALASAGKCALALLWDDAGHGNRLVTIVARPGHTVRGKPLASLSVERVPSGTRSTFTGSLRDLARREGVSVATVRRDLARAEGKGASRTG